MFTALRQAGFQVNLENSYLCQKELKHLGFWVSETGHKRLASRTQYIMKIKAPKTKKHGRMFMPTINFIQIHIKDRAKIMEPITKLTKDNIKWHWKEE